MRGKGPPQKLLRVRLQRQGEGRHSRLQTAPQRRQTQAIKPLEGHLVQQRLERVHCYFGGQLPRRLRTRTRRALRRACAQPSAALRGGWDSEIGGGVPARRCDVTPFGGGLSRWISIAIGPEPRSNQGNCKQCRGRFRFEHPEPPPLGMDGECPWAPPGGRAVILSSLQRLPRTEP